MTLIAQGCKAVSAQFQKLDDNVSLSLKPGLKLRKEARYGLVWDSANFREYVANAPAFDLLQAIHAGVPLSQAVPSILAHYARVPKDGEIILKRSIACFINLGFIVQP